jgi:hypothetical protein
MKRLQACRDVACRIAGGSPAVRWQEERRPAETMKGARTAGRDMLWRAVH